MPRQGAEVIHFIRRGLGRRGELSQFQRYNLFGPYAGRSIFVDWFHHLSLLYYCRTEYRCPLCKFDGCDHVYVLNRHFWILDVALQFDKVTSSALSFPSTIVIRTTRKF